MCMLAMLKTKVSYDLSFNLKAVKCEEERTRNSVSDSATACQEKPRHLGKGLRNMSNHVVVIHHGNSEIAMEIAWFFFSTESSSPIPGLHMCLHTWWPLTLLSFKKYDRSPAIDITLITPHNEFFYLTPV